MNKQGQIYLIWPCFYGICYTKNSESYLSNGGDWMQAFIQCNDSYEIREMPEPKAKDGEVIVKLKYAGLNRRDLYIPKRRNYDSSPLIVGSDGAGVVEFVGEKVKDIEVGDEVIINPSLRWEENTEAPPKSFDILGMPDAGTFAEKIAISAEQLVKKPTHLTFEESSVIALAATTGYRAMFTKGQLQKGETVFIPGAGSGVATFLIQYAKNIGARVIVSSRHEAKCKKALQIGADVAINTNEDWIQALQNEKIDLIIDSVGGQTLNRDLDILKQGGRLVIFGSTTEEDVEINLRTIFANQFQLIGTTMGSKEELQSALKHIETYKMHPIIDAIYPLEDGIKAIEALKDSKPFGKIALKIESL